jgi:hypothetical protein
LNFVWDCFISLLLSYCLVGLTKEQGRNLFVNISYGIKYTLYFKFILRRNNNNFSIYYAESSLSFKRMRQLNDIIQSSNSYRWNFYFPIFYILLCWSIPYSNSWHDLYYVFYFFAIWFDVIRRIRKAHQSLKLKGTIKSSDDLPSFGL